MAERGPKGDHGQEGHQGIQGVEGERGIQGVQGTSFSRTQVAVMFAFVVLAGAILGYRSEVNADRIDQLEQRPASCPVVKTT